MNISPVAPITPAWNHMVRILFKPFDFKKWLLLGFCAFLAHIAEGGGNGLGNMNNGSGPFNEFSSPESKQWISENLGLIIGVGVGILLLIIAFSLLITWISSRGKFMFLDGIVKNQGAVKAPWTEYKTEGNSLFLFSIVIGLLLLTVFLVICGVVLFIAMPDIQDHTWSGSGAIAIVVGAVSLLSFMIFCILFGFFVQAFMVPTMYLKRVKALEGMRMAWSSLCKGNFWNAVLLFLMMTLLGIGVAFLAIFVTCITCCLAGLPYVSSVVFLPILVFFACYTLCYIQQFGDDWQFLPPMCVSCGYDIQGLAPSKACPECGYFQKVKNDGKKKK